MGERKPLIHDNFLSGRKQLGGLILTWQRASGEIALNTGNRCAQRGRGYQPEKIGGGNNEIIKNNPLGDKTHAVVGGDRKTHIKRMNREQKGTCGAARP